MSINMQLQDTRLPHKMCYEYGSTVENKQFENSAEKIYSVPCVYSHKGATTITTPLYAKLQLCAEKKVHQPLSRVVLKPHKLINYYKCALSWLLIVSEKVVIDELLKNGTVEEKFFTTNGLLRTFSYRVFRWKQMVYRVFPTGIRLDKATMLVSMSLNQHRPSHHRHQSSWRR